MYLPLHKSNTTKKASPSYCSFEYSLIGWMTEKDDLMATQIRKLISFLFCFFSIFELSLLKLPVFALQTTESTSMEEQY